MDQATSQIVSKVLSASDIGGYKATRYIDRGASALVFEATSGTDKVALKVFDPTFLEKHGKTIQTQRIERQLLLKGKHHDNLVDILNGGLCPASGYHFIVMPFLEAPSLDKLVTTMPRDRIRPIISQLASAAEFLEKQNLFHRDIKPPNIALTTDFTKATLLDLGVILPLGLDHLADSGDMQPCVGTTQYSPPEFLLRQENDSPAGWRAVTFYQLGGVLHDLLMRRPLFHDRKSLSPRLVKAVMLETPVIDCTDVPPDLVRLAQACLWKDPDQRLRLVTWDSFYTPAPAELTIGGLKDKIGRLRSAKLLKQPNSIDQSAVDKLVADITKEIATQLKRDCIDDQDTFPPSTSINLPQVTDTATFILSFAPSTRHAIDRHLYCIYRVKIVQTQPTIIEISFAAALSQAKIELPNEISFNILYTGVNDSSVHEVVLKALYTSYAAALEEVVLPPASSIHSPITWL